MNADQPWPNREDPTAEEFRKLFVGGLDTKTTEETLKEYFSSYGTVESCEIMKDRSTPPKSKGFGFITFKSPDNVDEIQKNRPHEIDGRKIETKRATPKQQQYWATKKLYIKDFPKDLKEEELEEEIKDVFGRYGTILNVKLIKDKDAKDSLKGFGFIEFDDEDPVDHCNLLRKFKIRGQEVYVSKAYPQDKSFPGGRGGRDYYEWEMYPPMFDYYGYPPYGGGGRYNARRDYGYNYGYTGGRGGYQQRGGGGGGRPYRGGRY